jgi:hypothetical protein
MSAECDLIQLSNVVQVAYKYHYITTEAWALRTLLAGFSSQPVASILTHTLVHITEAAVLCEDKPLLDAVRLRWKVLISERKDLAITINVMGRLRIRDIEGLAYYGMVLEGRERWEADPNLTRDQRIRLLSGYHDLTEASEALMHTPPMFIHNSRCHDEDCTYDWAYFWENITCTNPDVGIGSPTPLQKKLDLMARLRNAASVMMALGEAETLSGVGVYDFWSSECRNAALEETMRMSRETEGNMMNFFEDVP